MNLTAFLKEKNVAIHSNEINQKNKPAWHKSYLLNKY